MMRLCQAVEENADTITITVTPRVQEVLLMTPTCRLVE
jgi:hypothetical protein